MASTDHGSSGAAGFVAGRSEAVTNGIRVAVASRYLPERSNPVALEYLFAYEVTVENQSEAPVRLLTRHWVITDALGDREEVEGVGVVGETPIIPPGASHVYTSYCPLKTQFGTMEGSYGMVTAGGDTFRARVAPWVMVLPTAVQ